jgi:hypothetical protein
MGAVEAYHLLGYHYDRLDGEFPVAVVEQVFQAGAKEVDDQDVVEAFLAEVIDIRDPGCRTSVVVFVLGRVMRDVGDARR